MNFKHHAQFFTATILEWKHLLKNDVYKDIIIDSLKYIVKEGRVKIYSFVIMPNHIHLIWQVSDRYEVHQVQQSFLKFTAHRIKDDLKNNHPRLLEQFRVNAKDRQYQFWERNSLSIDLFTQEVFMQKLDYIHRNPIHDKWKLSELPEQYKYSSAGFYFNGKDEFGFVSDFRE